MAQDFKKEVKKRLIDKDWKFEDLARAITEKTGLFCDTPYLSRNISGERGAPKIRTAICEILDIKEE